MKCCFSSNCAIRFILILGCLISSTKSWTWDIRCDALSPTQAYCARTMANIDDDDFYDPELPLQDVDETVEWLEAHLSTNGNWTISNHTIFHRFHRLKHLVVKGDPVLPTDVDNATLFRGELKSGLFAPLTTLKILSLQFWVKINIREGWKFPKGIEELSLELCNLTELDLREYTNLKLLDLSNNPLIKMPPLSDPRPPLRTLRLASNTFMKFTVTDIVDLCELRWLDLTYFNEVDGKNTDIRVYCECARLQKYMIALNISSQYNEIACEVYKAEIRSLNIPPDCKNYPVDEMIEWHKKKCSTVKPTTTTMEPEIEPWRPEPHPEPESEPDTPPPSTTKLPLIVCPTCPGCFLCVVGWFFFLVTLFSSGAAIAVYIVITKRLFSYSTVSRKK